MAKELPSFEKEEMAPSVMVIFGATGDLTAKKLMPAIYHLIQDRKISEKTVFVGVGRRDLTDEEFRAQLSESVRQSSLSQPDERVLNAVKERVFYHQAHFEQEIGYDSLRKKLALLDEQFDTQGNRLYYLATQPKYFPFIVDGLYRHQLIYQSSDSKWSRVILEKPFGTDLKSAEELQEFIAQRLDETQIYLVDHYLGKEGVQNLFTLRLDNPWLASLWDKHHIDNVQITIGESIGIGTRGLFWEETGALRDLMQNHLIQLLSIIAMEPPKTPDAAHVAAEKLKALQAIRPFPSTEIDSYVVRGQYAAGKVSEQNVPGYREELNVSGTSQMETYVAAEIYIDNDRWQGVPFYVRAGKRLARQVTEVVITFKAPVDGNANVLYIRIQPNVGVFFKVFAKIPGNEGNAPVTFGCTFDEAFQTSAPEAYEKLLLDALEGRKNLFVDVREWLASWKLFSPVLSHWEMAEPPAFPNYRAGSWGPEEAQNLLHKNGHHWELIEN